MERVTMWSVSVGDSGSEVGMTEGKENGTVSGTVKTVPYCLTGGG